MYIQVFYYAEHHSDLKTTVDWHANSTRCANESRYQTSGIDELDKLLGGGFPQHGVVEMESALGIGELRLTG
ncbi:hypothetical protein [Vibrio sp. 03_296]|uniref:hypothetical protein n=1 Tax=Vibrio sp. 03_296 TaxID=2024409 RepID=UPI002D7ED22A|nr:hypothetical protein [Vibrio sp. 03_296]